MELPRKEYPRPDFQRSEWASLNGEWEFEFDDSNTGELDGWYKGRSFSRKIIVPFCYQSKKSGIDSQEMHENLWYKRSFTLPEGFAGKRIFLNFGAVDYIAKVWVNGDYAGMHKGGYTPFKIDITRFITNGSNTLVVKAEDPYECVQPRGKQYWKQQPDRCWYTATSGIWQSVWLETTGNTSIEKLRITPDIDKSSIAIALHLDKKPSLAELSVEVSYKGSEKIKIKTALKERITKLTINLKEEDYIDEVHYWTPDKPNLYDLKLTLMEDAKVSDEVRSYFGMRKISVKDGQILLNNRPYYQKLILDQGYWADSLLTPPSDEAIVYDIEMTKKMGFNGARKHQKIEDPRYYYWADKLGLLVWGELPSPYDFNTEQITNAVNDMAAFIDRDYNHPCIITWVPLNESWGVRKIYTDKNQQDFGRALYYTIKSMDGTRLISTNDGWEQVESDICAIHDYIAWGRDFETKYADKEALMKGSACGHRMLYAEGTQYENQPVLMTEYGGIAFETSNGTDWGYNGSVSDEEAFFARYSGITEAIRKTKYINGYCYTQLTDVMQEVNGLMTMDRRIKVDPERIRQVNK